MPEVDLPDVNVWLALSASEHPFHQRARAYWQQSARERLAFCRVTMLGFLRLVGNATVMGGQPLSAHEGWSAYRAWRGLDAIAFAQEPGGCDALLAAWADHGLITPRLWTDAYLAAFAVTGAYRLVSFDRDFERFERLDWLRLVD